MISRTRRAVITGLGVVAPGGIGAKAFWEMLTAGRTATRPITLFDAAPFRCRIAAEVDFDPAREGLSPKEIRRMDRAGQFAVVATREALADSGLAADLDRSRLGVSLGSAIGNSTRMEQEYVAISDGGRDWLVDHRFTVPYSYSYIAVSSLATEVAWAARAEGPAVVVSAGCTSGLDAVGHAVQLIEDGTAEDPARDFAPAPGTLTEFVPPGGPFVRVDTAAYQGGRVSPAYDSLIAKLIVWAPDREQAIARMARALDEFRIDGPGIATTAGFLAETVRSSAFRAGTHTTSTLAVAPGPLATNPV